MTPQTKRKKDIKELDFEILRCSQPDGMGYIDDARALTLMKQGLIIYNPRKEWHKNGYKASEEGIKLFNDFIKKIREKHGHDWQKDESGKPDMFAYSEGYHNGFKCKKCGFKFCLHCELEMTIPKCSKDTENVTMSDDAKLDAVFVAMDKSIRASFGLGVNE